MMATRIGSLAAAAVVATAGAKATVPLLLRNLRRSTLTSIKRLSGSRGGRGGERHGYSRGARSGFIQRPQFVACRKAACERISLVHSIREAMGITLDTEIDPLALA